MATVLLGAGQSGLPGWYVDDLGVQRPMRIFQIFIKIQQGRMFVVEDILGNGYKDEDNAFKDGNDHSRKVWTTHLPEAGTKKRRRRSNNTPCQNRKNNWRKR